jgi:glycogen debranching enzyme
LRVNLTNPDLEVHGGAIVLARNSIQIERSWVLDRAQMFHRVTVRSYAPAPVAMELDFAYGADFADMFEVRGTKRLRRGEFFPPAVNGGSVRLSYRGLDGITRFTEVLFDPPPPTLGIHEASYLLNLQPDEPMTLEIRITGDAEPGIAAGKPAARRVFADAREARRGEVAGLQAEYARISTSNELMDSMLRASYGHLAMISNRTERGHSILAGIPWFATLFGRDSIITALSLLAFNPSLARGTLRILGSLQGSELNDARDEQPGKIVHEIRHGEMASTGEVPFGRYYESVDSTPLFLWLLGRYVAVTGDLRLAEELWPNVHLALEWIERWGDRDGDGYVEYFGETPRGLANQGWKDSWDAISHSDGTLATPPIALCEVQSYAYAAEVAIADVATRLGRGDVAAGLRERAEKLKAAFARDFWLEKEQTVALALDADKRPCRVMSSNAAHCLATGLLDGGQAAALSARLLADDMFSGWGFRTLGSSERRYNPMSYHNGSVWPHDNGVAAMGLARAGNSTGVLRTLDGLFDAAVQLRTGSLPELFCGFKRESNLAPVPSRSPAIRRPSRRPVSLWSCRRCSGSRCGASSASS